MPPVKDVHVGVAAVVRHLTEPHRILLVQRGGREEYADGYGTWAVPGGWLELGESPKEAAVRETEEETGLLVRALDDQGYTWNMSTDHSRSIVTLFVSCVPIGGEVRNAEPEKQLAVGWFDEGLLVEMDLFAPLDAWWRRPR